MTTPIYALPELVDNQASPYIIVNEAIRIIEAHSRVLSRTIAAEPLSPADGDAYILPAAPTGDTWSTLTKDDFVLFIGGAWKSYSPIEGWGPLWVNDADERVDYAGSGWQASSGGTSTSSNVETLSANKTILTEAPTYQRLDTGAANRIVELPATPAAAERFVILCDTVYASNYYIQVRVVGDTTGYFTRLYPGASAEFVYDATDANWYMLAAGHRRVRTGTDTYDNGRYNSSLGNNANAYNRGTALGYAAQGYGSGVAVGGNAVGNTSGVAVGDAANGANSSVAVGKNSVGASLGVGIGLSANAGSKAVCVGGYTSGSIENVAIGYSAAAGSKQYSVALGYNSATIRHSELRLNIDGNANDNYMRGSVGWKATTANATPVEMFLGGITNSRLTINSGSVMAFDIYVTGRDNTSGDCAVYHFEGAIKRDNAGNTVLIVANKTIIAEDDATWDCVVTADNTAEALTVDVTGDATNACQWVAQAQIVETRF